MQSLPGCSRWPRWRFKSQLQIGFSAFNFVTLAAIFITVFVFTFVNTAQNESALRGRLQDTAEGYTRSIATDSAKVFDKILGRVARNFLNLLANTASEYGRADYPYTDTEPTYYEWVETMAPPVQFEEKYNSSISRSDGAYSVAGYTPFTTSYPAAVSTVIARTQPHMPQLMSLFNANPEFISGYYCIERFQARSGHVFREYPGASNGNLAQLLRYDCTKDDWYQTAADHNDRFVSRYGVPTYYTGAYVDPWVKQTMITIVQPIYSGSGTFLGVAGGDLLTESIQRSISSVKYLAGGRAILFEVDAFVPERGVVIADTARAVDAKQTRLQSYTELGGLVSAASWEQMYRRNWGLTETSQGEPLATFVELDAFYVASQGLASGKGQYLLSIFVSKHEVTKVLNPVLESIGVARRNAVIVNSVVCFVVLLLAALINMLLAARVVKPVADLTADSALLIQAIGHDNLARDVAVREAYSDISETRSLQQAHANMIALIQTQAAEAQAAAQAQAQQQAAHIDYALPAYDPGLAFCLPAVAMPGQVLPMGIALAEGDAGHGQHYQQQQHQPQHQHQPAPGAPLNFQQQQQQQPHPHPQYQPQHPASAVPMSYQPVAGMGVHVPVAGAGMHPASPPYYPPHYAQTQSPPQPHPPQPPHSAPPASPSNPDARSSPVQALASPGATPVPAPSAEVLHAPFAAPFAALVAAPAAAPGVSPIPLAPQLPNSVLFHYERSS